MANPSGGSWSGPGISDGTTGLFDPAVSGVGDFSPVYTFVDPNGCEVIASPSVTVEAFPILTVPDTLQLCLTDENISLPDVSTITVDPEGGSFLWTGPGVTAPDGTFNADTGGLGTGFHTVTVVYERNECAVSRPMVIELIELEPLQIDPVDPVCISQNTL